MSTNLLALRKTPNAINEEITSAGMPTLGSNLLSRGYIGTTSTALEWAFTFESQTSSSLPPITFSDPHPPETSQTVVSKLKKLSGLTWEQIAQTLNVSRRSLHFWASGKPLTPFNEEHLRKLFATIRYINRGSADSNRTALLHPLRGTVTPLNLLILGKYEEVKQLLGPGKPKVNYSSSPVSSEVSTSRFPLSPADLVEALQDSIHDEMGRSRRAKTNRSSSRGRSQ